MNTYDRIAGSFHARIDAIAGAVDLLAPGLEAAAAQIVDGALNDHRILVCAGPGDAALADYAAECFRHSDEGIPPLPAIAIVERSSAEDARLLWQDLRTLSRDGDTLLCIDCGGESVLAAALAKFSAERNLSTLLLSERAPGPAGVVHLPLPATDVRGRRELALMTLHCLQVLIADLLMGG